MILDMFFGCEWYLSSNTKIMIRYSTVVCRSSWIGRIHTSKSLWWNDFTGGWE